MATEQKTIRHVRAPALPSFELLAGLGLGLASIIVYGRVGYGRPMLLLWLASALILAAYFWSRSEKLPRVATADLLAGGGLMLFFAPLYLSFIYRWPVQVNPDESTIMGVTQRYASRTGIDLFGLSDYWSRPALWFVPWGNLGELIGGIDLGHMRFLHALFGLFTIAASYALFQQLMPRGWAIFAASVLGFSHAFLMISRLAMRENTGVLVEVLAFALLLRGLRRDHAFSTYCGGFVAGLGFYVYQPGRATFPLWVLFMVALALLYKDTFPVRKLVRLGAIAAVGFVLMAGPVMIADTDAVPGDAAPRAQLFIYPEGRQLQQNWVFAESELAGFRTNVGWGLTTFNNHIVDHGWIYDNRGHGFVDPLSGILLWIGVAAVGFRVLRRRREEPWPLLMLVGFLSLWLAFAFLINKAPNYTRLLIILPFVAYFVTEAVRLIGGGLQRWLVDRDPARASRAVVAVAAAALAALAVGNIATAWDFVDKGRKSGDPIGSTGRYIAAHPDRVFYLSADESGPYQYLPFGSPSNWAERVGTFARAGQLATNVDPLAVTSFEASLPFGVFMNSELWNRVGSTLIAKYPQGRVRNVTPDGRLVVFEGPAVSPR